MNFYYIPISILNTLTLQIKVYCKPLCLNSEGHTAMNSVITKSQSVSSQWVLHLASPTSDNSAISNNLHERQFAISEASAAEASC